MPQTDESLSRFRIGEWSPDQDLVKVAVLGSRIGLYVIGVTTAALAFRAYGFAGHGPLGFDAHAYWAAAHSSNPYRAGPGALDAFLYSPAFLQMISPLALFPFGLFYAVWAVVEGLTFAWLLRPLGWSWGIPCWLLCVPELLVGNVVGLIALSAVLAIRRPEAWTVPLLTKITPGLIGGAWLIFRGQWRGVLRLLVATAVVLMISVALDRGLWSDWLRFLLQHNGEGHALVVRGVLGLLLVLVGARTGRAWLLAPAMVLVTPVIAGNSVLALLAAIPRLVSSRPASDQPRAERHG